MPVVLDASMTLQALFQDETTDAALDILEQTSRNGAIVPALWHLEVANALQIAVRRGRISRNEADQSLVDLANIPIAIDAETAAHAWTDTLALARDEGLTVYDAAYLELALRKRVSIASCDRALVEAARRRGLAVMSSAY